MYESDIYLTDDGLDQILYAVFTREPAPATMMDCVEQRLRAAQRETTIAHLDFFIPKTSGIGMGLWSIAAHAALLILLALLFWNGRDRGIHATRAMLSPVSIDALPPVHGPDKAALQGGGGGGVHEVSPVSKGELPKLVQHPVAPPMIVKHQQIMLTQEPALQMPRNMQPPDVTMPNLGDPHSGNVNLASNGSGNGGGLGAGSGGGIGSGTGNGFGPGSGGGTGGGIYHVGGGVLAPMLLFAPDPNFSEEARRTKYQGVCIVSLIVDAQGDPQRVRVVRPLGMGLDEKAIEAVKRYRFKPATFQGKPVPVEVNVEVNFRIY